MGRFNLNKGDRFNLKKSEGLNKIHVHLDWQGADLDASTFLCGDDQLIINDAAFVFYNSENRSEPFDVAKFGNKKRWRAETRPMSADGAVLGSIDDRSGNGGEDIDVDLSRVDPKVQTIYFCATVFEEGKTFGDVSTPMIIVTNAETGEELCSYELAEQFSDEDAATIAKLSIDVEGDWSFEAVGEGHAGGLQTLIDIYAGE